MTDYTTAIDTTLASLTDAASLTLDGDLFLDIDLFRKMLEDARRWNAFINTDRISLWGWAGLEVDGKTPIPKADGNVHFGGEFWTHHDAETDSETKERQVNVITAFADAAVAAQRGKGRTIN